MIELYVRLMQTIRRDERGAVAAEYGILISFIAIAIVAAVTAVGLSLSGFFDAVADTVDGWAP